MIIKSLDPRITRAEIEAEKALDQELKPLDHFETYEVFHQKKRGTHHQHVGTVHAPNPEMALLFGKEQYSRRGVCVNIWVVKTADIFASDYDDSDIFDNTPEKQYREATPYKVMDKINEYKAKQGA
ncbi:MAG: 1,2-phenylacetyl-CoA epoxidase subunit B [Bacteroidota bacterium]|nr:1,2-phenylacetyl-CoA epoxidase subunit B [Bacteroidota bacterium]MDX5430637.1 1,2-phenylacetyl-CoA epoxidase subunit B [Bacteroidota bacterium]MDX5469387.1 1,2-phenylacetyl-CoA epoxidase subunit B [Bacteroidota bacterium]